LEPLEDRCLLSDYTVTTTRDLLNDTASGEVTLRDVLTAIDTQAPSGNAAAGTASNTIKFAIGAPGSTQTIKVGSGNQATGLPALTHMALIDGWSQGGAGYSGSPLIVLNGLDATTASGLELDAGSSGSVVRGLVIQQFGANGITINHSDNNLVTANDIGTDATGSALVANTNDGVLISGGAHANTIGGKAKGAGNIISGNVNGVEISGAGSTENVVVGNRIGTDRTGTIALGNVTTGILVDNGASNNIIGGTAAGSANQVVGNLGTVPAAGGNQPAGVLSLAAASIVGNLASFDIELNYTDTPPAQMVFVGLDIRGSSSVLEPTNPTTAQPDYSAFSFTPSGNLGSGWAPVANAFSGEFVYQTPPPPGTRTANALRPNATYFIGTLTYDLARFGITPSTNLSISIAGTDTILGGETPGVPSTFHFINPGFVAGSQPLQNNPSANTTGIHITGDGTTGNLLLGNAIGTNPQGNAPLGHLVQGVLIDAAATGTAVGGTAAGAGNVVAGSNEGIVIVGGGTTSNSLIGNHVGTDAHDTINLANTVAGVLLENGASDNLVGAATVGGGNTIAFNGKGVVVGSSSTDTSTHRDSIEGNRIFANTGLGIDLGNDGPTPNGVNPREFANAGQNAPLITGLTLNSVAGTLASVANTTYRIELFATPVRGTVNQGQVLLRTVNVTTDATGHVDFTAPVSALPPRSIFTATATNLTTGDTSEFSPVGAQVLITSNPIIASSNVPRVVTLTAQVYVGNQPNSSDPVAFTITGLPGQPSAKAGVSAIVTVQFTIPANTPPGQYAITATTPESEQNPQGATSQGVLTITAGAGKLGRRWLR
jgi:hypothetical protein